MAMNTGGEVSSRLLTGICPDDQCSATLFFPHYDSSIECTNCGQRHNKSRIKDIQPVTDSKVALHNLLKNVLLGKFKPKKGTDSVKVRGISNYQCKLLSPLLTKYGMDKKTGKAILLTEMQPPKDMFDPSVLGDRTFLIEPEHIEVMGYGRDRTGSMLYLRDTLNAVKKFNGNEERLLPIHADGDGHCLVHAVSRALIGRELFWHALRENLKHHLEEKVSEYKGLFGDFMASDELQNIIEECDPEFLPMNGDSVGLRNIHIFGLANVLRRPIILLDSLSGLQSSGDYSGVFLPGLCPPENCSKAGVLNRPLCVAWSNAGRNHYIALVGVKGRDLPRLPAWMVPKVWGMPQSELRKYINTEADGSVIIGTDKSLAESYVLRLLSAMEEVFTEAHTVNTTLVADLHQYIYKSTGYVGVKPEIVLDHAQRAVESGQLYRCLTCEALMEWVADPEWFRHGGLLYKLAVDTHKTLDPSKLYSFPFHGYVCRYDDKKDELIPEKGRCQPANCKFCQGTMMRHVNGDGSVQYINGDKTKSRSGSTKCQCGYKHYWDGQEYDNLPEMFPISLDWGGHSVKDEVVWFQYESDPTNNSNVFQVAQKLVQKHFPGEFGSERLVQKVVDTILRQTAKKEAAQAPLLTMGGTTSQSATVDVNDATWRPDSASKIILTGQNQKTLHKEELNKSTSEVEIRKRIEAKAPHMQKRKTDENTAIAHSSKTSPGGTHSKGSPLKQSPKQARTLSSDSSSPSAVNSSLAAASPSQAVTPPSPVTPSGQADVIMPTQKRVRVTTSDGRQLTLTLDAEITYRGLQDKLTEELNVPGDRQKIKHGFPPKILEPPKEGTEDSPLHIQHGDKITVEIVAQPGNDIREPEQIWPAQEPQRKSWSGFDVNAHDQSAQSMLKGLEELQGANQNSLDTAIGSLSLMATLMGKDLWTYVQGMPHLFSVGGLFYQQVKRDLGLTDGKHCTLPTIHGKVFRFSSDKDRLELCLEPHGHFAVEPGIEQRVLKAGLPSPDHTTSTNHSIGDTLATGGIGVAVNHPVEMPGSSRKPAPFSGQGHSLVSENIRMPQDLEMSPHRHRAMNFHEVNSHAPGTIQEEEEAIVAMDTASQGAVAMETSKSVVTELNSEVTEPSFKRIGPGMTVLDDSMSNTINNQADMFRTLASQLEDIVRETDEFQDDINPTRKPNPGESNSSVTKEMVGKLVDNEHSASCKMTESELHITEDSDSKASDTLCQMDGVNEGTGRALDGSAPDAPGISEVLKGHEAEVPLKHDNHHKSELESNQIMPADKPPDHSVTSEPMDST